MSSMAAPYPALHGDFDSHDPTLYLEPQRQHSSPRQPRFPQLQAQPQPHNRYQGGPAPASPRWDSLQSHPHGVGQSPTAARSPPVDPRVEPLPHHYPAPASDPRQDQPRPLGTKTSMTDMRAHDGPIENFSRPRKQSIRQPSNERSRSRPPVLRPIDHNGPRDVSPQPSPGSRQPRPRPSLPILRDNPPPSPFYSASEYGPESRSPRARGFSNQGMMAHPGPIYPRTDSYGTPSPTTSSPPWVGGDEVRSSYRSHLSASSAQYHNTERSSVMTKNSSATSLSAAPDEPSIDDVMGMYENGFEDAAPSGSPDFDADYESRPATSASEVEPPHRTLEVVEEDEAMPASPAVSRLDDEIRQSKMFFFNPTFTSQVAHLATVNESTSDKRDSDKSLEFISRQPSLASPDEQPISSPTSPPLVPGQSATSSPAAASQPPPTPTQDQQPVQPPPSSAAAAAFTAPAAPPEEPGSRDRYGFKKSNQNVTRKQYDEWNKGYTEYLARRKKKWVAFLKDNSLMTDKPNRFPDSTKTNAKTKRFIRKGIPPEWRGAAWFYYAGGPAILRAHGGLYEKLLRKRCKQIDMEAIERDLHRTFPDNIKFKPTDGVDGDSSSDSDSSSAPSVVGTSSAGHVEGEPPIISSLRRVLRAFSVYNPKIGYCQSLNFIAGLLLLFVETEEQCFWLLNVITHIYLPGTHEISLEGSKVDLTVLMAEIRDTMPGVWDKIGGDLEAQPTRPGTSRTLRRPNVIKRKDTHVLSAERLPPITMCMTAWFMSCFIGTLPIETTLRVWDIFFYEGSKTLFRIALAIFKVGEADIKAVKDPMEMFGVVQALPRKMIDANALMEACFKRRNGFGHLTQGTIDERRQERRDTAQKGRDGKEAGSGNVTEVESEVRRKGTLFGKKKRDMSRTRTHD